jgi:hypothetical protein
MMGDTDSVAADPVKVHPGNTCCSMVVTSGTRAETEPTIVVLGIVIIPLLSGPIEPQKAPLRCLLLRCHWPRIVLD